MAAATAAGAGAAGSCQPVGACAAPVVCDRGGEVWAPDDELTTGELCGEAEDKGAKHICAARRVTVGLEKT